MYISRSALETIELNGVEYVRKDLMVLVLEIMKAKGLDMAFMTRLEMALDNHKTTQQYDFKKLCEFRHKWDDGWVCSKCGVRRADWIESDIKTTTREELY